MPDAERRADCLYDARRTGSVTCPCSPRECDLAPPTSLFHLWGRKAASGEGSARGSAQIGVVVVETVILFQVIIGGTRILLRVLFVGV